MTAIEENSNDKMFLLYSNVYPLMDNKNFKTFEEFAGIKEKKEVKKVEKKKSVQEILKDVELILMAK